MWTTWHGEDLMCKDMQGLLFGGSGKDRRAHPVALDQSAKVARRVHALTSDEWQPWETRVGYWFGNQQINLVMYDQSGDTANVDTLASRMAEAHKKIGGHNIHWFRLHDEATFWDNRYLPWGFDKNKWRSEMPTGGLRIRKLKSLSELNKATVDVDIFATRDDMRVDRDDERRDKVNRGMNYYILDLLHAALALENGKESIFYTQIEGFATLVENKNNIYGNCLTHSDCRSRATDHLDWDNTTSPVPMFCSKVCFSGGCGAGGVSVDQAAPSGQGYCQVCHHACPYRGYCTKDVDSVDDSCTVCGGTEPGSSLTRRRHTKFPFSMDTFLWTFGLITGPAYMAVEVSEELHGGIYQHLRVTGMSPYAYWLANLAFDFALGQLVGAVPFLVFAAAFGVYPLLGGGALAAWILISFVYVAIQLMSILYVILTFRFGSAGSVIKVAGVLILMNLVCFFVPIICELVAITVTDSYGDDDSRTKAWQDWQPWVNSISPQSAFGYGLRQLNGQYTNRDSTKDIPASDAFEFKDGMGISLLMISLWIIGELTALLVWIRDSERAPIGETAGSPHAPDAHAPHGAQPPSLDGLDGEAVDEDVAAEHDRVAAPHCDDLCIAKAIKKEYASGKVAVRSVSFGIRPGECFGLLGHNGAGKTTTIKALTGEHSVSDGGVFFPRQARGAEAGTLTRSELYRRCALAVCPQHDALWPSVTAREHMEIYLAMRFGAAGRVPAVQRFIDEAARLLSLHEYTDKVAGAYSGGTKRKLGVALAMFTGSRVVFLDEPSTGMDPFSRRALWRAIAAALSDQGGTGVLLTTHSMEEASSCCARIAIMASGTLRCLGSDNHLKARFGSGYTMVVYMSAPAAADPYVAPMQAEEDRRTRSAAATARLCELFPGLTLLEEHGLQCKFQLGKVQSLGRCFEQMEEVRGSLGIESYSISHNSSLEQIFIAFTPHEAKEEELPPADCDGCCGCHCCRQPPPVLRPPPPSSHHTTLTPQPDAGTPPNPIPHTFAAGEV